MMVKSFLTLEMYMHINMPSCYGSIITMVT